MELDHDYMFGEPEQDTCRVCLSTDSYVFYHVVYSGLQNDFHNITGIRITPDDELPQLICCICRELLRKAVAFRNKSISTQNMLSLRRVTIDDQNTVTAPLTYFTQTDTLIISIPAVTTTDDIETITIDLEDKSIIKEENVNKSERKDKFNDSETSMKTEANEYSFDDRDDFVVDFEVTSDVNSDSVKNVVKVKDANTPKTSEKAKPKVKTVSKYPKLKKSDTKMDDQSVKEYLLRTNTDNIYAEMLYTYIISKYIDRTKESNANTDEESDDYESEDSEDESTPLNKLIKVEDDSAEIINTLTVENIEDSKQTLYEFMKEKYIEKKKITKGRRARDLIKIKFKRDGRLVHSLKAMEELRKKCNVEIKILTLAEQIADVKDRVNTENYINARYKCEECFRGFQFERAYSFHMKGHDPAISGNIKCEVCRKRFENKRKLMKHQVAHKFRFICKECGRVCRNQNIAKEHAQIHSGKMYKCEYCFRVFCKPATRVNHIRIKHGSLQCEICYDLLAPSGLTMHNFFRHKEIFKCQCCDKKFNDADALAVHTSNATDGVCSERPCTKCGEGFATESAWRAHVEDHRQDVKRLEKAKYALSKRKYPVSEATGRAEPPRTVMCEMCGDMFISQAAMRYHQRIHTGEKPYACTFCPKRFRLKTLLTMHINTHTGERPYKCEKCPKDFKSQMGLYRHQLVHTKVRRHRCTFCDKTFQTSSAVKLHVKTVHFKVPMPPRVRNRKKRAE